MSRISRIIWSTLWLIGNLGWFASNLAAQSLEPLQYNNPGLVVDLGVGLWAWPIPCDADGDGDFDLIISCPDKPSNGVWLFENASGLTSPNKMPVFKPARFLSKTTHYVMPSYDGESLRVLSPGTEYVNFTKTGTAEKRLLPIEAKFHKPLGEQTKGPKVRHNQWRYADYDGDGRLDLIVGIEDWSYYGWDDAWDATGHWVNGPLRGWIYVFDARLPISLTWTKTATWICCVASFSTSSLSSRTSERERNPSMPLVDRFKTTAARCST